MSSANSVSTALQSGRRFHARRRIDGLTYVEFGTDNGAILIDLGEGGLGFQSILPVSMDQALPLKFKLPGDSNPIEGYAEVAWLDESRKGGGLRFVELSADACAQIRGWTGVLSAPNAGAPQATNRSASNSPPTSASERAPANSMPERTRPERTVPESTGGGEVPAQIYEAFGGAESAQIADPSKSQHHRSSSPCGDIRPRQGRQGDLPAGDQGEHSHRQEIASAETTGWLKRILATIENPWGDLMGKSIECAVPETSEAPSTDEFDGERVPAYPGALPGASVVPESAVHVIPAPDSMERLAPRVDSASSAAPSISATSASESALPDDPERKINDGVEAAASVDSTAHTSEITKTVGVKPSVAFLPSSDLEPRMQSAPPLEVSFGHADVARTREVTSGFSVPAPATPARATTVEASDSRNFVPVQKRQPRSAPSKPESRLQPADRQDSTVRGYFPRQSQRPVPAPAEWENLLPSQGEELKPQATLASQALKLGIGAAAGASLMLALMAGIPSLRTRVQTTVNSRLGTSNLANSPAFQVEVADLNNRRWILKSGGEAGSSLSDTPSRRERQPEASTAALNESAKPAHSNDSEDSSNTVDTPQLKLPRPRELALSRPHVTQAQAPFSLLMAPSIFDGITPPIGSVSDRLATSGLGAPGPGIVRPQNQVGAVTSVLQAAVLVQRVEPVYPKIAVASRVRGQVRLNVTVDRDADHCHHRLRAALVEQGIGAARAAAYHQDPKHAIALSLCCLIGLPPIAQP